MGDVQDFHYTLLLVYTVDDLVISYPDALDVYIFELLHHSLVFFYVQDDAHALTFLVHDVAGFHQFASLSV